MKRENIVSTRGAVGPSCSVEPVLHETGERVVEAVRKGEGSAAVTFRGAGTVAHMREKLRG